MGSHESIYEYWELIWRRVKGTAWLSQLSLLERKKCLDSLSFLGKTSRTLSGKAQVTGFWCGTGGCCQKGAMLTDTQQSLFSPKTCGSCKNNPPTPLPSGTPATIHSPTDRNRDMFFLRVSLLGMICAWVWLCKMRGVKHFGTNVSTTAKQLALISMRLSQWVVLFHRKGFVPVTFSIPVITWKSVIIYNMVLLHADVL